MKHSTFVSYDHLWLKKIKRCEAKFEDSNSYSTSTPQASWWLLAGHVHLLFTVYGIWSKCSFKILLQLKMYATAVPCYFCPIVFAYNCDLEEHQTACDNHICVTTSNSCDEKHHVWKRKNLNNRWRVLHTLWHKGGPNKPQLPYLKCTAENQICSSINWLPKQVTTRTSWRTAKKRVATSTDHQQLGSKMQPLQQITLTFCGWRHANYLRQHSVSLQHPWFKCPCKWWNLTQHRLTPAHKPQQRATIPKRTLYGFKPHHQTRIFKSQIWGGSVNESVSKSVHTISQEIATIYNRAVGHLNSSKSRACSHL